MPYLQFQGNCEAAFLFYQEAFGGEMQHLSKYGTACSSAIEEAPTHNKVMHAQLKLTDVGFISGADVQEPVAQGNGVLLHVHLPSEARAKQVCAKLGAGGRVLSPIVANPPPDDRGVSGAVQDQYGFTWILSAMKDAL